MENLNAFSNLSDGQYFLGDKESTDLVAYLTCWYLETARSDVFLEGFLCCNFRCGGFFPCDSNKIDLLFFDAEHDRHRKYH